MHPMDMLQLMKSHLKTLKTARRFQKMLNQQMPNSPTVTLKLIYALGRLKNHFGNGRGNRIIMTRIKPTEH